MFSIESRQTSPYTWYGRPSRQATFVNRVDIIKVCVVDPSLPQSGSMRAVDGRFFR